MGSRPGGVIDRLVSRKQQTQRGGRPDFRQCRSTAQGSDAVSKGGKEATETGKEGGNEQQRVRSSMELLLDTVEDEAPEFSFPLAVLLAGCAFEAYKEPVAGEGSSSPFEFCEKASNGTRTVYVDRCAFENQFT